MLLSYVSTIIENLGFQNRADSKLDRFAIKVCEKDKNEIVGHLPMKISRVTKFLLDRGANVSTKLTSTHYRRSPLVQGVIEIPCIVTVSMPGTLINQLLIERYKQLVETLTLHGTKGRGNFGETLAARKLLNKI